MTISEAHVVFATELRVPFTLCTIKGGDGLLYPGAEQHEGAGPRAPDRHGAGRLRGGGVGRRPGQTAPKAATTLWPKIFRIGGSIIYF